MFYKLVFQECGVEVTRLLRIEPQEEAGCYFYHILLVMEIIKASPDSRKENETPSLNGKSNKELAANFNLL